MGLKILPELRAKAFGSSAAVYKLRRELGQGNRVTYIFVKTGICTAGKAILICIV